MAAADELTGAPEFELPVWDRKRPRAGQDPFGWTPDHEIPTCDRGRPQLEDLDRLAPPAWERDDPFADSDVDPLARRLAEKALAEKACRYGQLQRCRRLASSWEEEVEQQIGQEQSVASSWEEQVERQIKHQGQEVEARFDLEYELGRRVLDRIEQRRAQTKVIVGLQDRRVLQRLRLPRRESRRAVGRRSRRVATRRSLTRAGASGDPEPEPDQAVVAQRAAA